ncbi:MAG: BMP family ABC transporter substrate-binding protein [Candidatus Heimdallarchaeota archaeon]|nr:BMP family ABC transporter substrate-binding protein [Candidatus Heimdallarchaeota archaeon]
MNKKLLTFGLAILFLASIHGTVASNNISLTADPKRVAIVYSTGGLGDLSFNDAADKGIENAKTEYGTDLEVDKACESACDITAINNALLQFADDADPYDLIIGIGFSSGDGIKAAAIAHPEINFMIIDSVIEFDNATLVPNVNNIVFKEQEGSFLAGAMAAMVTETKVLGFIGGLDIPLINRFWVGFEHGARYIDADISVLVEYSPDPNNPWGDLSGGAQLAETMMENSADIIFSAAGGTGVGAINAVTDANEEAGETKYYAIGVDSDQDYLSEGNVLTSMLKRVDVAVESDIDKLMAGTWTTGVSSLGIAEDGVGISPMTYTQDILNGEYEGKVRADVIDDLTQKIKDGDIVVAATPDDLDDIEVGQFEGAAFLPLPMLPIFIALFSTVFILKKKR